MPSKSVKTAKLYLASVWLCTPYATPKKKQLFKLGNSELWRPVIPDPVVGSRSAKKRFEILSMLTTYPKLIALRFVLTPPIAWKKKRTGGQLTLGPAPLRGANRAKWINVYLNPPKWRTVLLLCFRPRRAVGLEAWLNPTARRGRTSLIFQHIHVDSNRTVRHFDGFKYSVIQNLVYTWTSDSSHSSGTLENSRHTFYSDGQLIIQVESDAERMVTLRFRHLTSAKSLSHGRQSPAPSSPQGCSSISSAHTPVLTSLTLQS